MHFQQTCKHSNIEGRGDVRVYNSIESTENIAHTVQHVVLIV